MLTSGSHRRLEGRGIAIDLQDCTLYDEELRAILSAGKVPRFWSVPSNVRAVSRAVFRRDFGLQLELPEDRLFPTLASRLNYVLCVQDLLASTILSRSSWLPSHPSAVANDSQGAGASDTAGHRGHGLGPATQGARMSPAADARTMQPVLLDIGSGSSCVYGLLCAREGGWACVATEVDEVNIAYATRNVKANGLQHQVTVLDAKQGARNGDVPILGWVLGQGRAKVERVLASLGQAGPNTSSTRAGQEAAAAGTAGSSAATAVGHGVQAYTRLLLSLPSSVSAVHAGGQVNDDQAQAAHGAAENGRTQLLQALLDCARPGPSPDYDGTTPLFSAVGCNPPFFSSMEEAYSSASGYSRSSCTGAPVELVYPPPSAGGVGGGMQLMPGGHGSSSFSSHVSTAAGGSSSSGGGGAGSGSSGGGGEVSFVARMIRESAVPSAQHAVLWYTSMLGKASSVDSLLPLLRSVRARHVRVGQLYQGRTARWLLAWTWHDPALIRHEAWQYEALSDDGTKGGAAQPSTTVSGATKRGRPNLAHDGAASHAGAGPISKRRRVGDTTAASMQAGAVDPDEAMEEEQAWGNNNGHHAHFHNQYPGGLAAGRATQAGATPGPQRSSELLRAMRAFVVLLGVTPPLAHEDGTSPPAVPPHRIVCGTQTFVAVPSHADADHIRQVLGAFHGTLVDGTVGTGAAEPAASPSLPELCSRVHQALQSTERSGAADAHLALLSWQLAGGQTHAVMARISVAAVPTGGTAQTSTTACTDVQLCIEDAGTDGYECIAAWAGLAAHVSMPVEGQGASSAGCAANGVSAAPQANLAFRYEVQVLVPKDDVTEGASGAGGQPHALVCVCLLGPSPSALDGLAAGSPATAGSSTGRFGHAAESSGGPWQAFERLCDRLQRDVVRTGRKWRRQARGKGVAPV